MKAAGVGPTLHHYTAAMQGLSRAGRWRDVIGLFREMQEGGIKPDVMAFNHVLLACGR